MPIKLTIKHEQYYQSGLRKFKFNTFIFKLTPANFCTLRIGSVATTISCYILILIFTTTSSESIVLVITVEFCHYGFSFLFFGYFIKHVTKKPFSVSLIKK